VLRQPSNQQLDTVFETHKDVDVITFILNNGKEQHGSAIGSSGTFNISRGSAVVDSRSKGLSGI
jgi:predicted outer membrane repeat protein